MSPAFQPFGAASRVVPWPGQIPQKRLSRRGCGSRPASAGRPARPLSAGARAKTRPSSACTTTNSTAPTNFLGTANTLGVSWTESPTGTGAGVGTGTGTGLGLGGVVAGGGNGAEAWTETLVGIGRERGGETNCQGRTKTRPNSAGGCRVAPENVCQPMRRTRPGSAPTQRSCSATLKSPLDFEFDVDTIDFLQDAVYTPTGPSTLRRGTRPSSAPQPTRVDPASCLGGARLPAKSRRSTATGLLRGPQVIPCPHPRPSPTEKRAQLRAEALRIQQKLQVWHSPAILAMRQNINNVKAKLRLARDLEKHPAEPPQTDEEASEPGPPAAPSNYSESEGDNLSREQSKASTATISNNVGFAQNLPQSAVRKRSVASRSPSVAQVRPRSRSCSISPGPAAIEDGSRNSRRSSPPRRQGSVYFSQDETDRIDRASEGSLRTPPRRSTSHSPANGPSRESSKEKQPTATVSPTLEAMREVDERSENARKLERAWALVYRRLKTTKGLHRDQMPLALMLAGYGPKVDSDRLDIVHHEVSRYNDIDLKEFIKMVWSYDEKERRHLQETFRFFDRESLGMVGDSDFGILLQSAGVTMPDTPLWEISNKVGRQDLRGFSFEELMKAVRLVHKNMGFSFREIERFGVAFRTFDEQNSHSVAGSQWATLLGWLGFNCKDTESVLQEIGAKPTTPITWTEFLVVLRMLRNKEMDQISEFFVDENGEEDDSFLSLADLQRFLISLNCYAKIEVVRDAADDVHDMLTLRHKPALKRSLSLAYLERVTSPKAASMGRRQSKAWLSEQRGSDVGIAVGPGVPDSPPTSPMVAPRLLKSPSRGFAARRTLMSLGSTMTLNEEECEFGPPDVWQFMEAYRERDGFSNKDLEEIQEAFRRYDRAGEGEISSLEAGKILRWLGYPLPLEVQRQMVAEVDVGRIGKLDFLEFRKLVRKVCERDTKLMHEAFDGQDSQRAGELSEEQVRAAIRSLGFDADLLGTGADASILKSMSEEAKVRTRSFSSPGLGEEGGKSSSSSSSLSSFGTEEDSDAEPPKVNLRTFLHRAMHVRDKARMHYRKTAGYTSQEIQFLREVFAEFDEEQCGKLSNSQFHLLLANAFPEIATSARFRPHLLKVLEEVDADSSHALDFQDFLRTMRTIRDLQERDMIKKETAAIKDTKFEAAEVEEFRGVFLGIAAIPDGCDKTSAEISFDELARLVQCPCPLGDANRLKLQSLYADVIGSGDERAVFGDFLRLMQRLLDEDFGSLKEHTAAIAAKEAPVSPTRSRRSSSPHRWKRARTGLPFEPEASLSSAVLQIGR